MSSPFPPGKNRPSSVAVPLPSTAGHSSSTPCRDAAFCDPTVIRWLHSAGLQHIASSVPQENCLRPRNSMQDSTDGSAEESKPLKLAKIAASHPGKPSSAGVLSFRKGSEVQGVLTLESQHGSAPEIFDIHSINTELLSEDTTAGWSGRSSKPCSPRRAQGSKMELSSRPATADPEVRENQTAKIKVVVRKRPINKKEASRNEEDIITVAQDGCLLTVHETKLKVDLTAYVEKHEFVFDAILDERVTNDEVYLETVKPIIPTLFQQTKATCFAYGQTGSGKTFTMEPLPLKASEAILHLMQQPSYTGGGFQLWLSYFEIYGGKLFDLLNGRRKLCMREDGRQQVCIVGLKEFQIFDLETLKGYIEKGSCSRSTGSTGANEESSRSHAIMQLKIKRPYDSNDKRRLRMIGKLSFIDLAGSERGADTTDNDRQTRLEGAEINKSLLALKECIRALDSDQSHIPFRGSKLTEVLRDSFVGNSRTVMISCISPSSGCCEHTLNTLRYADRVKGLSKNSNAKRDPSSAPSQAESCMRHAPEKSDEPLKSDIMHFPSRPHTALAQLSKDSKQDLPSKDRCSVDDFHVAESTDSLERRQKGKHLVSSSMFLKEEKVIDGQKQETKTSCLPKSNVLVSSSTCVNQSNDSDKMSFLSKEEDYLVSAHCRELEDTINFVREEMKLLAEVDQPGSQINRYVSQLSKVLSRKAEGLVGLQARLERFQQLLKEQESRGLQPG